MRGMPFAAMQQLRLPSANYALAYAIHTEIMLKQVTDVEETMGLSRPGRGAAISRLTHTQQS